MKHKELKRDKYAWNQSFEDVDIVIPTSITNTKQVITHFKVSLKSFLAPEA